MSLENEFKKLIKNLKSEDEIEGEKKVSEEIFKDQKGEKNMSFEKEKIIGNIKGDKMEMESKNFEIALGSSLEAMKKSTKAFEAMQCFSKELEKSIEDMEMAMKSFEDLIKAKENISKVQHSIEKANESYRKMEDAIMAIK